ncbi:MAG: serine/threonine protein kinase [Sandaracinaceae bacterium]
MGNKRDALDVARRRAFGAGTGLGAPAGIAHAARQPTLRSAADRRPSTLAGRGAPDSVGLGAPAGIVHAVGANLRFGPYELVRRLGSGGMAETYLAVRHGPGGFVQHVCVKRILPVHEADPQFVKQFLTEARLAAQLRHASIAQVVDFGEVDGSHYLALELIDGMDLRALLNKLRARGERMPVPVLVHVVLEIARALDFAHTRGATRPPVIHRDISPSNVLVSRAGEVYLIDFGIARSLDAGASVSGVVRGKVPYMAPEYALSGRYDARTDLFSLGVLLFEALAQRRPFDGRTDLDTLQRIQEGRRPSLVELAPDTPEALVRAVDTLLSPDPARRPSSAGQLVDRLAAIAPPPTVVRELGALVRSCTESLSESLRILAEPTSTITAVSPGTPPSPGLPAVRRSDPGADTSTADPFGRTIASSPHLDAIADPTDATAAPEERDVSWSATDPTRISLHDRSKPPRAATPTTQPAARPAPDPGPIKPQLANTAVAQRALPPSGPPIKPQLADTGVLHAASPLLPRPAPPKRKTRPIVIGLVVFGIAMLLTYGVVALLRALG